MRQFEIMTDEAIIEVIRQNDSQALDYIMDKYKNVVRQKARTMYLIGGDNDDLIQEGMIGLFKAVRDFAPDKESSFATFARLCITRQLYTAVTASRRLKHSPLNSYVPLEERESEEKGGRVIIHENTYPLEENNPEKLFIDKESISILEEQLDDILSPFEKEVYDAYIFGEGYVEIANRLHKDQKAIDNALQRIRNKISTLLDTPFNK